MNTIGSQKLSKPFNSCKRKGTQTLVRGLALKNTLDPWLITQIEINGDTLKALEKDFKSVQNYTQKKALKCSFRQVLQGD